jgi:hypothetical protein
MGAQTLAPKRPRECEIGGPARERRQATNIGEAVQRPETDQAWYDCDFSRHFHADGSPSKKLLCLVPKGGFR